MKNACKLLKKDPANKDLLQECIGETVQQRDSWVPQCPTYPNLKGVSCDEVGRYIVDKCTVDGKLNTGCSEELQMYFKYVKIFDRDEMYDAFKEIGGQLNETMYEEEGHVRLLQNNQTVFITTPRGGYEALSVFSYANNLSKKQIPGNISEEWDKLDVDRRNDLIEELFRKGKQGQSIYWQDWKGVVSFVENMVSSDMSWDQLPNAVKERLGILGVKAYGKNWLGKIGPEIKRVVFVDDIVASAQQLRAVQEEVTTELPKTKQYSAHLCFRQGTEVQYQDRSVFKYKTLGIETFNQILNHPEEWIDEISPKAKKKFEKALQKEVWNKDKLAEIVLNDLGMPVTCAFPHAIPDGESDRYLQELYGSPEKEERDIGKRKQRAQK